MNTDAREQGVSRGDFRAASAEQRLKELGINVPVPPEPFGTYAESGAEWQSSFSYRGAPEITFGRCPVVSYQEHRVLFNEL
jgi:hypothetical protein